MLTHRRSEQRPPQNPTTCQGQPASSLGEPRSHQHRVLTEQRGTGGGLADGAVVWVCVSLRISTLGLNPHCKLRKNFKRQTENKNNRENQ